MPINYKNYPANWKTEIRPSILARAQNRCEFCNVQNLIWVFRGKLKDGREVYQTNEGKTFFAENSVFITDDCNVEIIATGKAKPVKIVLTVAHLISDLKNNTPENLRALCQRCHNRLDAPMRASNRKAKKTKNGGLFT